MKTPSQTSPDDLVTGCLEDAAELARLSAQLVEVKRRRHERVKQLRDVHGWSHAQVAAALGIHRGRAQDLYTGRS